MPRTVFFTLHVWPTDYDDLYSGERVEYVKVNGYIVNFDWFPMTSGCDPTAQIKPVEVVKHFPIDVLMNSNSSVVIEAKISDMVDECAYDENLFAGYINISCTITKKSTSSRQKPTPTVVMPTKVYPTLTLSSETQNTSAYLRCAAAGCTATADLYGDGTCFLSVLLQQTDFDGNAGSIETVTYLKVGGDTVLENVTPGLNPCNHEARGDPLSPDEMVYSLLKNHEVDVNGILTVEAQISPHVDECASNGYLLDATVLMNCTAEVSKPMPILQSGKRFAIKP